MNKLTTYLQAEQLPLDALLAEFRQQVEVGDLVTHVDYPEFRGRILRRDNGRCQLEILSGWRGHVPTWPVGIPVGKLVVVG